MKSRKNLLLSALLAMVFAGLAISQASAQTMKIGFVKDDRIRNEYPAWVRVQEQWNIESKAWDEEAEAKQAELQELIDEYEKQRLILSDDKKKEKEALIRTKQEALDAFTRQVFGPGGTAERKYKQLVEPLSDKATKAIEAVAIEGNYDVIFTMQSGLGYIRESFDVTDKVLEYLAKEEE